MGPNYVRPTVQVPANFRAPDPLPPAQAASLADLKWFEVFKDEKLQELIRTALVQNYDLARRGGARRAGARESRHHALQSISASRAPAAVSSSPASRAMARRRYRLSFVPSQNRNWGQGDANLLSFEVDIWGRLRRSTEAARANLLNAEENRKAVITTLVSDVASELFQSSATRLRAGNLTEYAGNAARFASTGAATAGRRRRDSARSSPGRTTGQHRGARRFRRSNSRSNRPKTRSAFCSERIRRSWSAGANSWSRRCHRKSPQDCPRLCSNAVRTFAPPKQALIAANANIGVAKAAYFPQLSLSGLLGGQSTQLASLFSGPHSTWSFVPQVSQPIFTAGRLKSNVKLAEAEHASALVQYEKTIQTAFTEVSNALIAHQRTRESRLEQERLVTALQDRKRLAYVRYRGGVDTQLNALDADRDLFQAELTLAQIRLNELLSVVQLYKALGGGWQ